METDSSVEIERERRAWEHFREMCRRDGSLVRDVYVGDDYHAESADSIILMVEPRVARRYIVTASGLAVDDDGRDIIQQVLDEVSFDGSGIDEGTGGYRTCTGLIYLQGIDDGEVMPEVVVLTAEAEPAVDPDRTTSSNVPDASSSGNIQ